MVGHHVAQRAGLVVVTAALFHAHGFGHGNLHVVDVAPVPDGLEDSVGETQRHDVLDGFLAQVVIDAIDLLFAGHLQQLLVQQPGGFEIVPEGFFDNHPPPVLIVFLHQAGIRELLNGRDQKIQPRWRGSTCDCRGWQWSLSTLSSRSFNCG